MTKPLRSLPSQTRHLDGRQTIAELSALYRLTDSLYRARTADDIYSAALDAIVGTLGCSRASVLLFDDTGVMRFVAWRGLSDSYRAAVDGHSPWNAGDRDPEPIFISDIDGSSESPALKAIIRAEHIRGLGFIPLVVQGTVAGKFMTYYDGVHVFAEHEKELAVTIARQLGFALERMQAERDRRTADDELRASEERFRLMSEGAPVMMWISDPQGRCIHLNSRLRAFWGVPEGEVETFDWRTTMHPEDVDEVTNRMGAGIAAQQPVQVEARYRRADGQWRILETHAQPYFSPRGGFRGMIGVNVDTTERTQAEEHRELLLEELNHRVKNTLAVVQGIAYQTFKGKTVPPEAKAAFEGRLMALATAHGLLTQSRWESASLRQLAGDALRAVGAADGRVTVEGPRVLLKPKEALSIAMALHELSTNALKYGALSNDTGTVRVSWTLGTAPESHLSLRWEERGGPPVTAPVRRGFGSRLIEQTLGPDLEGDVSLAFEPEGLNCAIDADLMDRVAG